LPQQIAPVGVAKEDDLHAAHDPHAHRVDHHRKRIREVLPEQSGGEGEEGDERQIDQIEADERLIHLLEQRDELVMGEPVPADHRETDEEADERRGQVVERVGELVDVGVVSDVRHSDRDDQQRHRDREETIAEGQHSRELDAVAGVAAGHRG